MSKEAVKITIRDNREEIILETSSETYAEDLLKNKEKLNLWWYNRVEYDNGKVGYDSCDCKARKIIFVNGRTIYADYTFYCDGKENLYDRLKEAFDNDFHSTEQPAALRKLDRERRDYMRQTHAPENKRLQPQEVETLDELKD